MRVLKFGGKSLSTLESINRLAEKVSTFKDKDFIIVVSAMGNSTENLIKMAEDAGPTTLNDESKREIDMLLGSGERVCAALFSLALQKYGRKTQSFTGSQAGILTKGPHNNASISEIKPDRIDNALDQNTIPIVAGFQGVDPKSKNVTTLGRGGSDLTALFLAKHYKAHAELYKSVGGIHTADPNTVKNSQLIKELNSEYLNEICLWGTKALHTKASLLAAEESLSFSFHDDQSFQMQTEVVKNTKEKNLNICKLSNIGVVVCPDQTIGGGFNLIKEKLGAENINVMASAIDQSTSRFLIDFKDLNTGLIKFDEHMKAQNLDFKAISLVSSLSLSEEQSNKAFKIAKKYDVKRVLTSQKRITFFTRDPKETELTNELHQEIVLPSQDKK